MRKEGLVYFRVPKAANSSIRDQLVRSYNLRSKDNLANPYMDVYWTRLPKNMATSLTIEEYISKTEINATWSFSMVRHPVTRLYSCWNNKVIQNKELAKKMMEMGISLGMSFEDFLERVEATPDEECDVHIRPQVCFMRHEGRLLPDFVGRIENRARDWAYIRQETTRHCGRDIGPLPQLNVRLSKQINIKNMLPDEIVTRIKQRYAEDFDLFYPGMMSGNPPIKMGRLPRQLPN